MKKEKFNYKILITFTLVIMVLFSSIATVFAYRGANNNQKETRQIIEQSNLNVDTKTELSEEDIERLIYGQQEERLARDVYLALYDQYGLKVFNNIAKSEDQHINAMGTLLDYYNIPQTEGYGDLQDTYNALIEKGNQSLQDALEVGVTIEMLDIDDIDESLSNIQISQIENVYNNLRRGSVNHLNAFVKNLDRKGFETDLDYNKYL